MRKCKLTLLGFFVLFLSVFSSTTIANIQKLDKIIAIVNEGIITQSQLDQELTTVQEQLHKSNAPMPPQEILVKQVLDKLIMEEIQIQYAKHTGIQIDDTTLDQMMSDIAGRNNLTIDQLRLALQNEGIEFKQFRDTLRRQNIIHALYNRDILNEVNVSSQEVDQFLKTTEGKALQGQEYRLSHILVVLPEAPAPEEIQKAQLKADELLQQLNQGKDFAQMAMAQSKGQHALSGGDLGWRSLAEIPSIFLDTVATMEKGDIRGPIRSPSGFHVIKLLDKRAADSKNMVLQKTQARHILIKTNALLSDDEARFKLRDFKRELESGTEFAILAKTHSEDLASANQGGDLGWVTAGQLVPEFSAVMDETSIGEISEPFKTPFGWHILQVLDRKEEKNSEIILKQNAMNMIKNRKAEEKLENWLRQMRDEAYIQVHLPGYTDDPA